MRRGNLKKFGRKRNQRKALYRSLVTALIEHGKIKTTEAKAKLLPGFMDKIINKAKQDNLSSRKLLIRDFGYRCISKLINDVMPRLPKDKKNGYARIVRLGQRKSDGALTSVVELILTETKKGNK